LPAFAAALCSVLVLISAGGAHAFQLALSDEDNPQPLHWAPEDGGPIEFRHHYLGGGGLYPPLLEAATRKALQSWSELPDSEVSFREGLVFSGQACPHALPLTVDAETVCGGDPSRVDGQSALFFIETVWPFGEEVIALTSLSYEAGGRTVDADISFNGVDYLWSLGETGVRTDYESIVLHETGHLLGLGHSLQPGVVMSVDYEDGQLVRTPFEDDALGLAQVYPCPSPPCIGGVSYEGGGGCAGSSDSAGGSGGWALRASALPVFVFLGLAMVRRRPGNSAWLSVLLVSGALLASTPVDSSTAVALDVADLAQRADLVVHARVVDLETWRDGIAWTRVEFEVLDAWKGDVPTRLQLVVPGGWTGDFGTLVFGMPTFALGEETALFLAGAPEARRVLGLSQGKFTVAEDGSLSRDLSGLRLALVGGHRAPRELQSPSSLAALRRRVTEAQR